MAKSKQKAKLSNDQKLTLYRNLVRGKNLDHWCIEKIVAGQLVGFYHAGAGTYAPGVALASFLNKDDVLSVSVRSHGIHQMLSKGIDIKTYLAEHTARETGCCKGRSSFHSSYPEDHVFGTSGFIGANFPPSVGWGLAAKKNGRGQVVANCFGDGGSGRGTFHEAALMANNWKLPIIFQCENNGLAIFSKIEDMHPTENISDMAAGYGMPAVIVDGQDVIACAEAALAAIEHCRSGKGPYMIEAKTLRFMSHSIGVPDLADFTPRDEAELKKMHERDPVVLCEKRLLDEGILTLELIEKCAADSSQEIDEINQFIAKSPAADKLDLNNIDQLIYAD